LAHSSSEGSLSDAVSSVQLSSLYVILLPSLFFMSLSAGLLPDSLSSVLLPPHCCLFCHFFFRCRFDR
jgi:hypothetical protein